MAFFAALFPHTQNVSLESLLELFFERTGTFIETQTQIMIWINPTGLSKFYRTLLTHIIEGLNKMNLLRSGNLFKFD
jgi:DNA-binding FadR family transcriptional regulator